jgi:hypothetical protein
MTETIIKEAKERYKNNVNWEGAQQKLSLEDIKFAYGDSDNHYQWPTEMYNNRELEERPALTINAANQHCLQIINAGKKHRPQLVARPTGNGATFESAQVWSSIFRYIEYHSGAATAYDKALEHQVYGGIGYWRITTDYVSDDSFDQDIYIKRIVNPFGVFLDVDAKEADKSDGNYGIIFETRNWDLLKKQYPSLKGEQGPSNGLLDSTTWATKDQARVAEYYRRVLKRDKLFLTPTGATMLESDLGKDLAKEAKAQGWRYRDVMSPQVEWNLIVGDEIVDSKPWLGKFIPIVPVIGFEEILDGKLERKGHVRNLKDPNRMYNYWASAAVEYGALQSKTPWVTPTRAIEGHENDWNQANLVNKPYLLYNDIDDDGQKIAQPVRIEPPVASPVAPCWYASSPTRNDDFKRPVRGPDGPEWQRTLRRRDGCQERTKRHRAVPLCE